MAKTKGFCRKRGYHRWSMEPMAEISEAMELRAVCLDCDAFAVETMYWQGGRE